MSRTKPKQLYEYANTKYDLAETEMARDWTIRSRDERAVTLWRRATRAFLGETGGNRLEATSLRQGVSLPRSIEQSNDRPDGRLASAKQYAGIPLRAGSFKQRKGVMELIRLKNPEETPGPGIYRDVPFDCYRSWDCVNNSSFGAMLKSPAHYQVALTTPREPTEALKFGTLAHAGKLEPMTIAARYVVMPDFTQQLSKEYKNPRNSGEYKDRVAEFKRVNDGKEIVQQEAFDRLLGILEALNRNERAREYLSADGPAEVSLVWEDPETGLRCKGRIDKLDVELRSIADLKTTCKPASDFQRSIAQYSYHRQAAFYTDGLRVLTGKEYEFCLVAVERHPPHGVRAAPLGWDSIVVGREEYRTALRRIAECRKTGEWPDYEQPDVWELPAYKFPKTELVIDGRRIEL